MAPTPLFCPNPPGPARGQTGRGHRGIPSQQDPRGSCHVCHHTCSATQGTVWSRRRPSAETVVSVVTWLAQGCPVQAIVAACGCDERTVAAGWARAGRQGQAVHADLVEHPRDVGPGQAEASRVKTPGRIGWMALALMVKPRVWLGGEVRAQRHLPLIRRLIARVRRGAAQRPLWGWTEGWAASIRASREPCREPVQTGPGGRPRRRPWRHVVIAPGVTRDERRRVVETARRMVAGPPARVETLRGRSPGGGGIKTASSARLNATCRARLAPVARRGRALARQTLTWHAGMFVVGPVSNLCTPQASVAQTPKTTPAMAAGIPAHGWTMHARLSCHVPPSRWSPPKPRGRPSPALQRVIEPWCGDHG